MRSPIPTVRRSNAHRLIVATLFAAGLSSCTSDAPSPIEPRVALNTENAAQSAASGNAIVVGSSAELVAALTPENAGRRILIRAGSYALDGTLVVPDGVTLEGEGVMQLDDARLPIGFAAGTRTTLVMTANTPGNMLTLGDGVTVRKLAIEDLAGRPGSAVAVVSRASGDHVSATIEDVEILNPSPTGVAPQGPTGCGIAVLTLNPNMGGDPPPHAGAVVGARISRTIIRSPATGPGCGVFAFNFAPQAEISVQMFDDVVGGGIIASGGVSRPDAVHDSRTNIQSHHNLYRDDTPDGCVSMQTGWLLQGGSGVPIPLPVAATERNTLRVHSENDRLEGFSNGIFAAGGRRFFFEPLAGALTDNSVELELVGTTIATPVCGSSTAVADLQLMGGSTSDAAMSPGTGNTVRVLMRDVTGSGARSNVFADLAGPSGPLSAGGSGNRLEITGNLRAFEQANRGIDPLPDAGFFSNSNR